MRAALVSMEDWANYGVEASPPANRTPEEVRSQRPVAPFQARFRKMPMDDLIGKFGIRFELSKCVRRHTSRVGGC